MVDAQKAKEGEMSEQDSLLLVDAQQVKEAKITDQDSLLLVDAQQVKEAKITDQDSLLLEQEATLDQSKKSFVIGSHIVEESTPEAEWKLSMPALGSEGFGADPEALHRGWGDNLIKLVTEWKENPTSFDEKKQAAVQAMVNRMKAFPSINNPSDRVGELVEMEKVAEEDGDELTVLRAAIYEKKQSIAAEPELKGMKAGDFEAEEKKSVVRKKWTLDEINALVAAVRVVGKLQWGKIKKQMGSSRTGDQLRSKWIDMLSIAKEEQPRNQALEIPRSILNDVLELDFLAKALA